jgi:protein arginine kinase activator
MACFLCDSKDPNVFFQDSNIEDTETPVCFEACESCLLNAGWNSEDPVALFSLFKINAAKAKVNLSEEEKDINCSHECPQCHSDILTVAASGLVGCEKCYESYRIFIHDMLDSKRVGENRKELENAMRLMNDAIEDEDYERAAELRDMIAEMEKK